MSAAIRRRRTHKQYGKLVDLARHAPNHKLTQPWRFRVLGPDARSRLEAACGEKEAIKLRRAPTLIVATAVLSGDPHMDHEDLLATACAIYAVLLGATDRGLASYWRTPLALDEPAARTVLGLEPNERIVALIHLGPVASEPPEKERAPLEEILSFRP